MVTADDPIVVVADDDPDLLSLLECQLTDWGYQVRCAQDSQELRSHLSKAPADLVLLDLHFGQERGLDVLSGLVRENLPAPMIVLTAYGSIETAVQAMKLGAYDYVTKPPDWRQLRSMVREAIDKHRLGNRVRSLDGPTAGAQQGQPMLGDSPAMLRLRHLIAEAAPSHATVLILGESGTGKELVARAIHERSPRATGPFVPVNMAALPANLAEAMLFGHEKGAFTGADTAQRGWCEMANEGTLFLDEIGEMDITLQAKLLRFLQERQIQRVGANRTQRVDVRIVAATNRNPLDLVREGRLREDLYYRLNVVPIELPPLRERREDIALLAAYFLQHAAAAHGKPATGISREALRVMESYQWPGNVRQLENLMHRLAILSARTEILPDMLPAEFFAEGALTQEPVTPAPAAEDDGLRLIDRLEKQAILDALVNCEGNVVQAGQLLGMGQATIYRKIKRYDIQLKRRRRLPS